MYINNIFDYISMIKIIEMSQIILIPFIVILNIN